MPGQRRTALFLVLVALAATVLLALALPGLRLAPGMPLPIVNHGSFVLGGEGPVARSMPISRTALLVLLAGAAALILAMFWRALRGVRLRNLGPPILRGVFLLGAVCLAILLLGVLLVPGVPGELDLPPPPAPPELRTPLGQPPPLVLWITAAALVLGSTLAAAWMLAPRRTLPDPLLARLGLEAGRARAALTAGEDAREIILSCYARMSAALEEGRGLERPASMTAHEFCERLAEAGLPRSPVRELTGLFEAVRYGRWAPTPADEARALACLGPIVEACLGPREGAR